MSDNVNERVVDILLEADKILERYWERTNEDFKGPSYEPPGLTERLLVAQLLGQSSITELMSSAKSSLSTDIIAGKLDDLRNHMREDLKDYIDTVISSRTHRAPVPPTFTPPPSQEEVATINGLLKASGAPDFDTVFALDPQRARRMVADIRQGVDIHAQLLPVAEVTTEQVHHNFEDTLKKHKVDMHEAQMVLTLLLSTQSGIDMLKLMVMDAARINRVKPTGPPA